MCFQSEEGRDYFCDGLSVMEIYLSETGIMNCLVRTSARQSISLISGRNFNNAMVRNRQLKKAISSPPQIPSDAAKRHPPPAAGNRRLYLSAVE